MEHHSSPNLFERPKFTNPKSLTVKWFKEWVPQDVVTTGGKCLVLKWVTEAQLKAIREKAKEVSPVLAEPEPEPTTEVLFLCSYEGCGKTFIDAGALRKHSHIHGDRQYVCHYENCGKKFLDSSKLKRHFLIHTGARDFVCPHEGCGKAFSLDFNLRSHMKTHSQENYHICHYPGCGKRFAHEYKLKNHIVSHHEKQNNNNMMVEAPVKYIHIQPVEKRPQKSTKAVTTSYAPSPDRPYACPYEGCVKAYIHEYKLNLHLKREHPGHFPEENTKNALVYEMDAGSDHDGQVAKRANLKSHKQTRPKPDIKLPPAKVMKQKGPLVNHGLPSVVNKQPWAAGKELYEEEDSEETEEERDNGGEDRWGYRNINNDEDDDDEDTEYED
ncbi:zinc finger transcription factor YY1-like isoform X1 [Bidens hawaiensis]|uniref:zinc finger transcription factor YY1-like isoform X1 n=1 Tax=Bidens hawaiensis TaxID=980011 RepID=UPI00404A60A7